ncbi:MAG: copper chaperone PCu(A)C [Paucibacter sp.]|nr:copper chaperone PCu(A)C [Roseateles sp.]
MNKLYVATLLAGLALGAQAQSVEVTQAWARATVPGQSATGVFAHFKAPVDARLVGVSTPAAGIAQVHEMKMVGDVMQMRELEGGLALPAGQEVALTPGGQHIMLMQLHQALPVGSKVPVELRFVDAKGHASVVKLEVPVQMAPPKP